MTSARDDRDVQTTERLLAGEPVDAAEAPAELVALVAALRSAGQQPAPVPSAELAQVLREGRSADVVPLARRRAARPMTRRAVVTVVLGAKIALVTAAAAAALTGVATLEPVPGVIREPARDLVDGLVDVLPWVPDAPAGQGTDPSAPEGTGSPDGTGEPDGSGVDPAAPGESPGRSGEAPGAPGDTDEDGSGRSEEAPGRPGEPGRGDEHRSSGSPTSPAGPVDPGASTDPDDPADTSRATPPATPPAFPGRRDDAGRSGGSGTDGSGTDGAATAAGPDQRAAGELLAQPDPPAGVGR